MSYALEYGEGILQQIDSVWVRGGLDIQGAKGLLTSRYLVFFKRAMRYGKEDEEIARIPISSIRVFNNSPQVFIAGDSLSPRLDIYLDSMNISLSFSNIIRPSKQREEYQKWISSISSVLCSNSNNQTYTAIPNQIPQENPRPKNPGLPISSPIPELAGIPVPMMPPTSSNTIQRDNTVLQRNFCGNCGEKIDGMSNFCKYCGAKLK